LRQVVQNRLRMARVYNQGVVPLRVSDAPYIVVIERRY